MTSRGVYFLLLLALAAGALGLHRAVPPGLVFGGLAALAHGAAEVMDLRGRTKALLFLQTLPFFALGVAVLGRLEPGSALLQVAAGASLGAALLAGEAWAGRTSFTASLVFLGLCALAGLALSHGPAELVLGTGLAGGVLAGYGLARRRA